MLELDRAATDRLEARRRASRDEMQRAEAALAAREKALAELHAHLEARASDLDARAAAVDRHAAIARARKKARHALTVERRNRLAERAGTTVEATRAARAQALVDDAVTRLRKRSREHDERRAPELHAEAVRTLAIVISRYDGVGHLERLHNTYVIEDETVFSALVDSDSEMARTISAGIACTWTIDHNDKSVTVHATDSAELCAGRRLLKTIRTGVDGSLQKHITTIKEALQREIRAAGREAFAATQLAEAHPDIVDLIGRLKFRLSFSQNQWKHSIEVARLAGMLAAELGVDRVRSRRGGLLHDMGKAMTHDHEGSHAVLGATIARTLGEDEIVANAIGAHHNDEPMASPVAFLVTAADAISGARPGARRESATTYVARVRQIHEVASRGPLVERVDVMYAGREVRVIVSSESSDEALHPLAQRIARALEAEIDFPGQIRVTVIRESRVSAIAR